MNCWHCNTELIWGGDHDIEHEDSEYLMETNLSCPNCGSFVIVYLPEEIKMNVKNKIKTYDGRHEIFEQVISIIKNSDSKNDIINGVYNFKDELEEMISGREDARED